MELKNTIMELKNSLEGLMSRQDQARVGKRKYRSFETVLPALFNASFLISVLHLTAVISHLGSGAPIKVFLSIEMY